MTLMLSRFGMPMIYRDAEGAGAGGGTDATATATPESVLFPNEGGDKPADGGNADGNGAGNDKHADTAGQQQADWKPYEADPAKSFEENLRLKEAHDKTKPAEGEKKNGKDAAADQVPDDGKYELTMPEGVEVDKELLDAVSPRFKELGLTRAQAQALTDDFVKIQQQRAEGQMKTWGERIQGWADDAKADKEIGGDKWNSTVENATRFTKAFGTPALREYLNASGGGNHPEVIRIFAKAGELIREDNPASGGAGGAGKPADPAYLLFPNDAPKG